MNIYEALWQDDERMSGAVCFRGTRVPLSIMFEYLAANRMEEFYSGYPNVTQEQVQTVLKESKHQIESKFPQRKSA